MADARRYTAVVCDTPDGWRTLELSLLPGVTVYHWAIDSIAKSYGPTLAIAVRQLAEDEAVSLAPSLADWQVIWRAMLYADGVKAIDWNDAALPIAAVICQLSAERRESVYFTVAHQSGAAVDGDRFARHYYDQP